MDENPRIAMIVLMKGKLLLITELLMSIVYHSQYDRDKLDIYIADTGSSDEEILRLSKLLGRLKREENLNCKLIKFDYYNFGKINNAVVRYHVRRDTDMLLFCNNDVSLINDAISIVANEFVLMGEDVGTIGARLMYPDNTVQHAGMMLSFRKGVPSYTHFMYKKTFHGLKSERIDTWGNTGAFMAIPLELFEQYGGFNEAYKNCFEDVELNLKLIRDGKRNRTCLDALCWHFESTTRGRSINEEDIKLIREFTKSDQFFFKKNQDADLSTQALFDKIKKPENI